jgi:tetratricopeptide (TPR) repeat protein
MRQHDFYAILLVLIAIACFSCGSSEKPPPQGYTGNPVVDLKDANQLLAKQRCADAVEAYGRFLAKFPKDAGAWNLQGLALLCDQKPDQAVNAFKQAQALAPTFTDVHNNLGVAYVSLKNYAAAETEFQTALADTNYPAAGPYFNLARVYYLKGNYEEARALAKKSMMLSPKEVGPRLLYGLSLQRLGRLDEASTVYHDLLVLAPANSDACYYLGEILIQQGKPCEAREYLSKVVDADPLGEVGQKAIAALKTVHCTPAQH